MLGEKLSNARLAQAWDASASFVMEVGGRIWRVPYALLPQFFDTTQAQVKATGQDGVVEFVFSPTFTLPPICVVTPQVLNTDMVQVQRLVLDGTKLRVKVTKPIISGAILGSLSLGAGQPVAGLAVSMMARPSPPASA